MIDLSGTIHIEDKPIPGAIEAVAELKKSGVPHLFVTNTSKESRTSLHSRLQRIGFTSIESSHIYSSLSAAVSLVRDRELNPLLILEPNAVEDFPRSTRSDTTVHDSVLVGLAPSKFDHETLSAALRVIKNQGGGQGKSTTPLLAVNKSRYIMTSDGLKLGPGFYVAGLEFSSGVEAEVIGKPKRTFFNSALKHMNTLFGTDISTQETVMIGDDIKDDVIGAQECEFQGCLVKTGKYCDGDEDQLAPLKPDYIHQSITEAIKAFIG